MLRYDITSASLFCLLGCVKLHSAPIPAMFKQDDAVAFRSFQLDFYLPIGARTLTC